VEPPAATHSAAVGALAPDDLKLIEGIGPKIAELLAQNGIATFGALADASAEQLRALLLAAGRRFAIIDPTTWPAQAALAAKGDLEALQTMQASLKGGRKIG
jgi:predicted flap endonuclease-1-like 5' DNA nuclease